MFPPELILPIGNDAAASDDAFNSFALRLFHFQYENNSFYRNYCNLLKVTAPEDWHDIPAVPAMAFKRAEIRSFPMEETTAWFQTSGTTEQESGRHFFSTLEFYEAAILPNFRDHLIPDCHRLRMMILTPPPEEAPHSSLVHMMKVVRDAFGDDSSRFYFKAGKILYGEILHDLAAAGASGQAVFLLGTAFAFVYLLDEMTARNISFRLPPGSRIMETGGFKGRTREIERQQFYDSLSASFGIPPQMIVNEYGMTELSSQFYDRSMASGAATNHKNPPAWTRVLIVNPLTGKAMPEGETGAIRIFDLSNVGSVAAIQTEDSGIQHKDGFSVTGRIARAAMRGCSLDVEKAHGQR